jgi:ketosteroid isomerase-like protein
MDSDTENAVKTAAAHLVAAFAGHDREEYFACFAPEATFVFHNFPHRLETREEYFREWRRWETEDGFQVESCLSTGQRVQLFGDIAVFTHSVSTEIGTKRGKLTLNERETIVFQYRPGQGWIAVHEHLSVVD